jgi:hypothetical protein
MGKKPVGRDSKFSVDPRDRELRRISDASEKFHPLMSRKLQWTAKEDSEIVRPIV